MAATFDALASRLLAAHPDVRSEFDAQHEAAWSAVDARLLELCRARVAMLLGVDHASREPDAVRLAEWPTAGCFSDADRACLAFTEQFVIDVASLGDEVARAVADDLGTKGLANFVSALLVVEQRIRLQLIWEGLGL